MAYGRLIKSINSTKMMRHRRRKFRKSYPRASRYMTTFGKLTGLQRQVSMLKGIINSEKHYVDTEFTGVANVNGSLTLITPIAQGDDVNNRDGNSVLCKYLLARLALFINSSATSTLIRCIIICDTANQGSTPSVTDYLSLAGGLNTSAPKNVDNQKRFVTLYDKTYSLNINGMRAIEPKIYVPTNFHLRYSSNTSTSVLQNACYMLLISNESVGGNTPTCNISVRNAFYDN